MTRRRNGFTLIELVVVILILGILAGVGAPKLFSTSGLATENGTRQTLSVVRNGIELYASANGGQFPACTVDGKGPGNFHEFLSKYIRGDFPSSLVGSLDNSVKPSTADPLVPDGTTGWMYNTVTGEFICNSDEDTPSGSGKYNEL